MPQHLKSQFLWLVEGCVLGQQPWGIHICAPGDQSLQGAAVLGARTRVLVSAGLQKANLYLLHLPQGPWLCKSPSRDLVAEKQADMSI